ncbi:unnamed protein product [Psylliodes chrysocephalus]|uniref:Uncharacterized protein n=1 Tax=Psylliodes chrysocephalus TaxID=3402493 RepID=A0A9P0D1A3_9CUCU|nr:unnamed protein product [Psylliodes chrysocephala]
MSDIECFSDDDDDDDGWESDQEIESDSDLPNAEKEVDESQEGITTNEEVQKVDIPNKITPQPGTSREQTLTKKEQEKLKISNINGQIQHKLKEFRTVDDISEEEFQIRLDPSEPVISAIPFNTGKYKGFLLVQRLTGSELSTLILKRLETLGLNSQDMRGQAYDNETNRRGDKSRIKR